MNRSPSRRLVPSLALTGLVLLVGALAFFRSGRECKVTPETTAVRGDAKRATPSSVDANSAGQAKTKAAAAGQGTGTLVDVIRVEPQELVLSVPATGTLLPRESVTLVSELSRRLVHVTTREGKAVDRGEVLFRLDAAELYAQRKRLQIELDLAKRMAQRQTELLAESATTAAEADQARSAVDALIAQIQVLDVELSKTTIRAPFTGLLGLRRVSAGAWVTPSTPLITISDTSSLKIDFRVPERHAAQVLVGTEFNVRAEGAPGPLSGVVLASEPAIDETSRSLLVRGIVQTKGDIVPGTFAKIELPIKDERALLLPPIAIIPGLAGISVYVVQDGVAHLTPVEQGARTKDAVQITSGLSAGDQVIVSNLLRLRDGAPVQIASGEP